MSNLFARPLPLAAAAVPSLLRLLLLLIVTLTTSLHAYYSNQDLSLKHASIQHFDIITSLDIGYPKSKGPNTASNNRLRRNAIGPNDHERPAPVAQRLQFYSLGRDFSLILTKPAHLTTRDFQVHALDGQGRHTRVPYDSNNNRILQGHLEGEPNSLAFASFDQRHRLVTAQIKSGPDTFVVEPLYLHKDSLVRHHNDSSDSAAASEDSQAPLVDKLLERINPMIVYNLRDHKQFSDHYQTDHLSQPSVAPPPTLCGSLRINDNDYSPLSNDTAAHQESGRRSRARRNIDYLMEEPRNKTRCTLHLVADYLFYKNVGRGDRQTTINYLLALVNRVNQIYLPTEWETGEGGGEREERFSNVGFTVQDITIHEEFTRLSSNGLEDGEPREEHYNMQSNKTWAARDMLDNFSRNSPAKHYCLAHLFTYRSFDKPVLGLAYVASTRYGTIGGICSPPHQRGDYFYKHNTGISTSKGISGETLITRQADLLVAHELGHNMGAEHDSNECRPSPSQGGAYLMHPFSVMGFEKNNRLLSNCSKLSIGRVIKRKASTCFIGVPDKVCGNGIVEDNEQCDGGDVGHVATDPCCDSSCRFTPGSQCSDRHSWCCSKCQIVPAGRQCGSAEEYNCKQAPICDGRSPECPEGAPVEDGMKCVGRGFCYQGNCTPFCEFKGLFSCLCTNPTDACRLCCKPSQDGVCSPYDRNSSYLPDGLLCYRGVCERGRCEQPIQDVVERLWDVLEDINFTTFVKFLRDNIILVVLVVSIPIWCILTYYINKFDSQIRDEVFKAISRSQSKGGSSTKLPPSPFLPSLFVGNEPTNFNLYTNDTSDETTALKQSQKHASNGQSNNGHQSARASRTGSGRRLETNV